VVNTNHPAGTPSGRSIAQLDREGAKNAKETARATGKRVFTSFRGWYGDPFAFFVSSR
jgi:hypothetical protein